jgi:predicted nucleic acid-binding protein
VRRLVVTDTGPLIHLAQADSLGLLKLVGEIHLPETVRSELERGSTDISELDVTVEQVE